MIEQKPLITSMEYFVGILKPRHFINIYNIFLSPLLARMNPYPLEIKISLFLSWDQPFCMATHYLPLSLSAVRKHASFIGRLVLDAIEKNLLQV